MRQTSAQLIKIAAAAIFLALSGTGRAADAAPVAVASTTTPVWLIDLSLGVKESYDDNVLVVSGLGLPVQSSWVNTISFKAGLDVAPILAQGSAIQALTLVYQPDRVTFASDAAENYTAHRINDVFKGRIGSFSYSLDNAFLYNDGNKLAETYALNQLSGATGNQLDKYRNNFTHAVPRERRNQDQDRYTAQVQWDAGNLFFRPISSLTYYNLNTYLFNTSKAPYLGYQDYVDRWDVNAGADLGFRITKNLAFTVGYRDGEQHQDPFALAINSDQHYSSNHYQRLLVGIEGQVTDWLNVKLSGGPDFRDYNPDTAIDHLRTTRFFGEGQVTAILSKNQTLTVNYKQWLFVSSTGLVPYEDTVSSLVYHVGLTSRLGVDFGAKYFDANYTIGNDLAGSAPSLRDDTDYQGSIGLSYAILRHVSGTVGYAYDKGLNGLHTLAATYAPAYRDFEHGVVSFGLKYAF